MMETSSSFFSFFLDLFLFYFVPECFCLHVFMCTTYMSGAHRDQKRESDTIELELQRVVNYYMSTGDQTRVP